MLTTSSAAAEAADDLSCQIAVRLDISRWVFAVTIVVKVTSVTIWGRKWRGLVSPRSVSAFDKPIRWLPTGSRMYCTCASMSAGVHRVDVDDRSRSTGGSA